jgi:hypothetical protein
VNSISMVLATTMLPAPNLSWMSTPNAARLMVAPALGATDHQLGPATLPA